MARTVSGEAPWRRSRIVLPVASPAAGAEWSLTVPAGHVYRPIAVYWTFTSAVAAANRLPRLAYGDGVRTFLTLPPTAVQAASLADTYAWLVSPSGGQVSTAQLGTLLDWPMEAGWTLGSQTDAIQAADQYSAIFVLLEDTTVRDGSVDVSTIPSVLVEVAG